MSPRVPFSATGVTGMAASPASNAPADADGAANATAQPQGRDPADRMGALLARTALHRCGSLPGLVKVCGLTRQQDVTACAGMGVDLAGFIFHPKSPRNVTVAQVAAMETYGMVRVGVFVAQGVDEVMHIMREARLDLAQLHGGQDAAFCAAVGQSRVMRVCWPERHATQASLAEELQTLSPHVRLFLFDAGASGGGHGTALRGDLLRGLAVPRPWLLAGGLGPRTVVQAARGYDPAGYDFNSGVESAPGIKDARAVASALAVLATATCNGDETPRKDIDHA